MRVFLSICECVDVCVSERTLPIYILYTPYIHTYNMCVCVCEREHVLALYLPTPSTPHCPSLQHPTARPFNTRLPIPSTPDCLSLQHPTVHPFNTRLSVPSTPDCPSIQHPTVHTFNTRLWYLHLAALPTVLAWGDRPETISAYKHNPITTLKSNQTHCGVPIVRFNGAFMVCVCVCVCVCVRQRE